MEFVKSNKYVVFNSSNNWPEINVHALSDILIIQIKTV